MMHKNARKRATAVDGLTKACHLVRQAVREHDIGDMGSLPVRSCARGLHAETVPPASAMVTVAVGVVRQR